MENKDDDDDDDDVLLLQGSVDQQH